MIELDCESCDSCMDSICQIYGVGSSAVESVLNGFDLEQYFEEHSYELLDSGDAVLRNVFEEQLGVVPKPLDRVFWFHLTRALPGANFHSGLLPLTEALDSVWDEVENAFRDTPHRLGLAQMRSSNRVGYMYRLKAGVPLHAGPFAMLVRDVAFYSQRVGNYDYLNLPEIMRDICDGYREQYGEDLGEDLRRALVPTVVKFWSARQRDATWISPALLYLYAKVRGELPGANANSCFDGENVGIPFEQISSVQMIEGR